MLSPLLVTMGFISAAACTNLGEWHLLELCSVKSARLHMVALPGTKCRIRPRVLSHSFSKH